MICDERNIVTWSLLSLTQNLSYIIYMKLEYNNRKRMLEYGRDRAAIYLTFIEIRFGKHIIEAVRNMFYRVS